MKPMAPTRPLPAVLRAWFLLDLVLALSPPLHWWAGTRGTVLGLPRVLVYLFGTGVLIVLNAFAIDRSMRRPPAEEAA